MTRLADVCGGGPRSVSVSQPGPAPRRWEVTAGMGAPSIGSMPIAVNAGGREVRGRPAWRVPTLLTRRRSIDYCRVATALCPVPRQRQAA
jgi:hypothetical protein